MRILMLSWEYPPRIVGGLGRHVHRLATGLADEGHEVTVISREHPDVAVDDVRDGVRVVRVGDYPPIITFDDLVPWVLQLNLAVQEQATRVAIDGDFDVVHAHDWLVAYAAAALKNTFGLPLIGTVHATEWGRHQGHLPGPMNKLIHQVEWWLTYEARRVITCSRYMADQVHEIFELPRDKQDVIPNGVDLHDLDRPEDADAVRASLVAPGERMLFYAGRLEYEKGVQTILDALPLLDARGHRVKLFVAGVGTHGSVLEARVVELGLSDRVEFLGFIPEDQLRRYYAAADVALVPSLYEPFGMVALETMAADTPCIVADTGGLKELVVHDATGLRFTPGDASDLAATIDRLFTDTKLHHRLTVDARRMLDEQFNWRSIARRTVDVYERAIIEERALRRVERTPLRAILGRSPLLRPAVDE
jgi:glycogen(starch) synthase